MKKVEKKTAKKKLRKVARSAVTGRLVPMWYALENPATTVIETAKKK